MLPGGCGCSPRLLLPEGRKTCPTCFLHTCQPQPRSLVHPDHLWRCLELACARPVGQPALHPRVSCGQGTLRSPGRAWGEEGDSSFCFFIFKVLLVWFPSFPLFLAFLLSLFFLFFFLFLSSVLLSLTFLFLFFFFCSSGYWIQSLCSELPSQSNFIYF